MKVHILMRSGPEWGEVIDVYDNLQIAETIAKIKNDSVKTSKDVFEQLSHYNVVTKIVKSKA